jgi:alkanesulfonate monooxygenase SsuD/methylene tetrahydromethanopterin reductase-like flavin-dependent oxidoreductase (luciferase family)
VFFGLRFDFRNPAFAGVTMAERYAAALDMCEWADQRGAVFVGLSEHHGADDGYLPSPIPFAAAVAARTTNVRIGIAAVIAPFHDPLRLAEDLAVVDLLSNGRLDPILAAGYVADEFAMFGVPLTERRARMEEAVHTLRAAWTGEPFEFRGRTARVTPTPAQDGGPNLVLGGSSDAAARRAARIGDGFIPSEPSCWAAYRDECAKVGKPDPGPGMTSQGEIVLLAEDPEQAWDELGPYLLHHTNAYGAWLTDAQGIGAAAYRPAASVAELRDGHDYLILTPDELAAHLEPAGDFAFVAFHPMVGGIPPELAWRGLHLFAEAFL